MAGLAFLCGCSLLQNSVPANRIRLVTPQGSYDIHTPKNVAINNFLATVESNGVLRVSFTNWVSTNDPLVIDKAAAGQVAIINAWNGLVSSAVQAAGAGMVKGP